MKFSMMVAGLAAAATLTFADPAEACSRKVSAKAAQTAVPTKSINQGLLNEAVRAEVEKAAR